MSRYPFPRESGEAASAARSRVFAWRAIAVYAVIYGVLLAVLIFKVAVPAIEAGR